MAFPVLAMAIGAGIGALYTKSSGGSNRDMMKNMLLGAALGTGAGYAAPGMFGSAAGAQAAAASGAGSTHAAGLMSAAGNTAYGGGLASKLGLSATQAKMAGGAALAAPMMMGGGGKPMDPQGFDEGEYSSQYDKSRENLQGLGERFNYDTITGGDREFQNAQTANLYNYQQPNQNYAYATGGIVNVNTIAKFKEGGVNYLPSKLDHDEKDQNNYVRAEGYIEDATDIADKDKDTMLAQLADGEFVSRADAILGAGIMQGANPKDFKEMRKEGAKFFYTQQDQLKRIYDMVS